MNILQCILDHIMPLPSDKPWRDWIDALDKAGIKYRAHYDLADRLYTINVFRIPQKDKVEMLVDYAMAYYNNVNLDNLLGYDKHEYIRNDFLEVLF